jgi:tetratricopeptide (TPR) repeat protein
LSNKKDYQLAIDAALSNVFLRQKDWRMAIETLDHLMELMPGVYQDDELLKAYQIEVLMRQGRIFLEVGALDEAETIFARAASTTVSPTRSSQWIFAKIPAQLALHQGLAQFARRSYNESMASFKQASDHLRRFPEPVHSYRLEEYLGPTIWVESPQALLTQAWNNMGLAALYTCRMKEAVRLMESLVREDPTAYLTERLAFNLCTLYELGADTAASARKKRVLQLVAKRFFLHDIGPEQFRIS